MKRLSVILISLGLGVPALVSAQNDIDALRYSQSSITGTARYAGMGGAFGAVGGDFSSLSDNPAGIGIYRSSEFTFTPSFYGENTSSTFLAQTSTDNHFDFNIGDLGLVFVNHLRRSRDEDTHGWKRINFAIGYNRLNDFNTNYSYQGVNPNNSYLDYIVQNANGSTPAQLAVNDPFYGFAAYQTYLINPNLSDSASYTGIIPAHSGELQRVTSQASGHQGEMVFSLGASYDNRLYIGGTLGIDHLDYVSNTTYQEFDVNNNIPNFNNFSLNQYLHTTGTGANFKFGLIFAATNWLRLGAAIHTPTFYSMHDDYSTSMTSNTLNNGILSYASPQGYFDYNLTTPYEAIGSAAIIVKKIGLVSVDYEYVNYSTMSLTSNDPNFDSFDINNTIQSKYTSTGNIKVGTEWRIGDIYRVRAGYALFGSPFASGQAVAGADQTQTSYTAGFGMRDSKFSIDIAYVYAISNNYTQEYSLTNESVPGAINKVQSNNFLLTFGFRF